MLDFYCCKDIYFDLDILPGNGTFNGTYNELNAIANSVLRHSYAFSLPTVSLFHPNVYSFHRGVSFFPPWWKESFPVMESNFLHGGKNKYLLQFYLTVVAKRDKSGDAAA